MKVSARKGGRPSKVEIEADALAMKRKFCALSSAAAILNNTTRGLRREESKRVP